MSHCAAIAAHEDTSDVIMAVRNALSFRIEAMKAAAGSATASEASEAPLPSIPREDCDVGMAACNRAFNRAHFLGIEGVSRAFNNIKQAMGTHRGVILTGKEIRDLAFHLMNMDSPFWDVIDKSFTTGQRVKRFDFINDEIARLQFELQDAIMKLFLLENRNPFPLENEEEDDGEYEENALSRAFIIANSTVTALGSMICN